MSYQFFSVAEIQNATSIYANDGYVMPPGVDHGIDSARSNPLDISIEHPGQLLDTPGKEFVYKAELINAYQENGTLNATDMFKAQQTAELRGFQSDLALQDSSEPHDQTTAGRYIRDASLLNSYNQDGYVTPQAAFEADTKASLYGPLEEFKFSSHDTMNLSPGGELVRDSDIIQDYLENENWTYSDIYSAEVHGSIEGPTIDYLF